MGAIKLPPHSIEAEQSVLGALFLSNAGLDRIEDRVAPADFYSDAHRTIYREIRGLILTGKPADVVTVTEALRNSGLLDRVGGIEYLGALLEAVPTAANIEHYAELVRDKAVRRAIATYAMEIGEIAMGHDDSPAAQLLEDVQRRAFAISDGHAGPEATPIGDLLPGLVDAIEKRENAETPLGIHTGLTDLDAKLCGLQPGDLVVIAGRPSMGKTSLAMQFAIHVALESMPALVFSLEMQPDELAERALGHIGRVNGHALRSGRLNGEDWERVATSLGRLQEIPLYIDGSPRLTIERMRARAKQLQRKRGLGLVVVDYIQLMDGSGDGRNEQVSSISRGLKLMANELRVPVIALSQLSRKCEERTDKRPMLSDLRDSGAVEQDADVVMFVYRDEMYYPNSEAKGMAEIIIGKHRKGETGRMYATFLGSFNRFENAAWRPTTSSGRPQRKRRDLDDDDDE